MKYKTIRKEKDNEFLRYISESFQRQFLQNVESQNGDSRRLKAHLCANGVEITMRMTFTLIRRKFCGLYALPSSSLSLRHMITQSVHYCITCTNAPTPKTKNILCVTHLSYVVCATSNSVCRSELIKVPGYIWIWLYSDFYKCFTEDLTALLYLFREILFVFSSNLILSYHIKNDPMILFQNAFNLTTINLRWLSQFFLWLYRNVIICWMRLPFIALLAHNTYSHHSITHRFLLTWWIATDEVWEEWTCDVCTIVQFYRCTTILQNAHY